MRDDRNSHRQLSTALVASLVSILATLLGVVVSEAPEPRKERYAVPIVFIALIGTLVVLAFVYARAYLEDLRNARRDVEMAATVTRAMPYFVSFKRRVDMLSVEPSGDATLTWEFELASRREDSITELGFPIFAEVPAVASPWTAIRVEAIEVNEEARPAGNAYHPVERRWPVSGVEGQQELIIEYGLLRVPVELERGRDSCRVRVRIRMVRVFPNVATREVFYVDIPYITERLRVLISAKGNAVRRAPRANETTLVAMSGIMEVVDPVETAVQNTECQNVGNALVWETGQPKLGYRYKVYFRLERAARARRGATT